MGEDLAAARVLVATVLVDLGSAGMVGAWASALWLRHAESTWAIDARRRSWTALRVALAATVLADGVLLWLQAAYMGDLPLSAALATVPSMLVATHAGHAWAGGAAGLAIVAWAVGAPAAARTPRRLAVIALAVAAFVYCRAVVSHAGEFGLASVPLLVQWVHLLSTSLWLGGVGVAAYGVSTRPDEADPGGRTDVANWVRSLSSTASVALAVIVATGLLNAWRGIGSAADLRGTAYGETLLVKVELVAVAVVLGGINRFGVMPRWLGTLQAGLETSAPLQRRFVWILRIEAVVLLAALVAAAVLGSSPLPPTAQ